MEKKKLLLVAVTVGVFLVIAFAAAILIFKSNPGVAAASETSRSSSTDISVFTQDESLKKLQTLDDPSPIHNMVIDSDTGNTVISVPKPATSAVPTVAAAPKPAAKPAAPAAAKPAPAAPKKASRDYWVQAGSFSTRERADGVKGTLSTKGITAIVSNQEINGSTFYRVRVGPYTTQNEADYWLAMIKSIEGFQESQIWESQSYR